METINLKDQLLTLVATMIGPQPIPTIDTPTHLLAVPEGYVVRNMEGILAAPVRTRGTCEFHDYPSFIGYVNSFKSAGARIFVTPSLDFKQGGVLATAYLDYPEPGKPAWTTHVARLVVAQSLEYRKLTNLDGKLLSQDDFARSIRDVASLCISMSAADLIDLTQTIALTAKGDFRSYNDDFSGSVNLLYDVKVSASAGTSTKKLEVPQEFSFHLPLLLGGAPVSINAEFFYRIPSEAGGKVSLGIRIQDRQFIERDVLQDTASKIGADTSVPVGVGTTDVPEADESGIE